MILVSHGARAPCGSMWTSALGKMHPPCWVTLVGKNAQKIKLYQTDQITFDSLVPCLDHGTVWNQLVKPTSKLVRFIEFQQVLENNLCHSVVLQGMWSIGKKPHPIGRSLFLGAELGDSGSPVLTVSPTQWEYPTQM